MTDVSTVMFQMHEKQRPLPVPFQTSCKLPYNNQKNTTSPHLIQTRLCTSSCPPTPCGCGGWWPARRAGVWHVPVLGPLLRCRAAAARATGPILGPLPHRGHVRAADAVAMTVAVPWGSVWMADGMHVGWVHEWPDQTTTHNGDCSSAPPSPFHCWGSARKLVPPAAPRNGTGPEYFTGGHNHDWANKRSCHNLPLAVSPAPQPLIIRRPCTVAAHGSQGGLRRSRHPSHKLVLFSYHATQIEVGDWGNIVNCCSNWSTALQTMPQVHRTVVLGRDTTL